jgi:hypothetical protein
LDDGLDEAYYEDTCLHDYCIFVDIFDEILELGDN